MSVSGLNQQYIPNTLDGLNIVEADQVYINGSLVNLDDLVTYENATRTLNMGIQNIQTSHNATTGNDVVNKTHLDNVVSNLSVAIAGTFLDKVTTTPQTVIGNVSYTAQLSADDLLVPATKKASLGSVLTVDANYRRSETDATVSTVQYFGSITSSMGIYQATSTQNYAILQVADLGLSGTGKRMDINWNLNINEASYNSSIQLFASDNGTNTNQYLGSSVSFTPSDSLYKVMSGTFVPQYRYICALCITAKPSGVQTVRWYGLQLDEQGVDITALTMSAQGANQIPIINDKKQLVGSGVSSSKVVFLDNCSEDIQTALNNRLKLDGSNANQDIVLGGYKVQSSATPTTGNDLTNKTYVDGAIATGTATIPRKADVRTGVAPNAQPGATMSFYFGTHTNNNIAPFSDMLLLNGWTDSTAGSVNLLSFNKGAKGIRQYQGTYGSTSAFSTYYDAVMTDANSANVTLGGTLALGANKATSSATPTTDDDLCRKGYVDTQDGLRVLKVGDTMTSTLYNSGGDFHAYRGGDTNRGCILTANNADGATYASNNGGLASWFGISFRSTYDNTTRFVFNTRDGSSSQTGTMKANGVNIDGLTASRALGLDSSKNVAVSTTTLAELDLLSGVSSSVQNQLNAKGNLAGGNTWSDTQTFNGLVAVSNRLLGVPDSSPNGNFWMGLRGSGTEADRLAISINGDYTTGAVAKVIIGKALRLSHPTADRVLTVDSSGDVVSSSVTPTVLSYLDIGSSLSGLLGLKANLAGPQTFSGTHTFNSPLAINLSAYTGNRVLTIDASKNVTFSTTTSTELDYLSGTTSSVQNQINGKVSKAGDTMTGALTISTTAFAPFTLTRTSAGTNFGVGTIHSLVSPLNFQGFYARSFGGSDGAVATSAQSQCNGYYALDVANDGVFASDVDPTTSSFYINKNGARFNVAGLGIGGASKTGVQLKLADSLQNRKIVLFDGGYTDDHRFYGFGIMGNTLRFSIPDASTDRFSFFAGAGSSGATSTEVFRINGTGALESGVSGANANITQNLKMASSASHIDNNVGEVYLFTGTNGHLGIQRNTTRNATTACLALGTADTEESEVISYKADGSGYMPLSYAGSVHTWVAGNSTDTNVTSYTFRGQTGYDGSNFVNLQCQASQYGRNQLILTGRYELDNDAWSFTTARNAIRFRTQSSLNSAYTNRWTIQNFKQYLGFLSSDTPTMVFNGSSVGVGYPSSSTFQEPIARFTINSSYTAGDSGCFAINAYDGTAYSLRLFPYVQAGGQVAYQFRTYNQGTPYNSLAIGYNGNVGIGTTLPSAPLDVYSTTTDYTNNLVIRQPWAGVVFDNTQLGGGRKWGLFSGGSGAGIGLGNFGIFDITASRYRFSINSTGQATFHSWFRVDNGDISTCVYGPNATWNARLRVGAATSDFDATTAQVIATNGNLHLDAGFSKDLYLNFYQNANGQLGNTFSYGTWTHTGSKIVTGAISGSEVYTNGWFRINANGGGLYWQNLGYGITSANAYDSNANPTLAGNVQCYGTPKGDFHGYNVPFAPPPSTTYGGLSFSSERYSNSYGGILHTWGNGPSNTWPVFIRYDVINTVYLGAGSVRCSQDWDLLVVFMNGYNFDGGYFYVNKGGGYGVISDSRIKQDFQTIEVSQSEAFLKAIEPTSFCIKDSHSEEVSEISALKPTVCSCRQDGWVAQNVLEACKASGVSKSVVNHWYDYEQELEKPEEERKTLLGVSDRPILSHTVNVVKGLMKRIEVLEAREAIWVEHAKEQEAKMMKMQKDLEKMAGLLSQLISKQ